MLNKNLLADVYSEYAFKLSGKTKFSMASCNFYKASEFTIYGWDLLWVYPVGLSLDLDSANDVTDYPTHYTLSSFNIQILRDIFTFGATTTYYYNLLIYMPQKRTSMVNI